VIADHERTCYRLADKTAELTPKKPGFLLIDDGPIADAFLHTFQRTKRFDPH
jgi:hypothetical protein